MSREDVIKVGKDIERVQTERDANLAKLKEEVKKLKSNCPVKTKRIGIILRGRKRQKKYRTLGGKEK